MSQFIGCADAGGGCASPIVRTAFDDARAVLPGPTRVDTRSPFSVGASTPTDHPPSLLSFAEANGVSVWVSGYAGPVGGDLHANPARLVQQCVVDKLDLAAFLRSLDGHFSVVVVEHAARRVHIATDRLGSVPVFTQHRGSRVAWSTRFSAMRHLPGVATQLNVEALESFLRLGSLVGEATYFEGVESVPAASLVTFDLGTGSARTHRYWTWRETELLQVSEGEAVERFGELWERAIARLMAFRPHAAIWLSGGFDSRLILAEVCWQGHQPPVITVGEPGSRETLVAQHLAERHGLACDVHQITADVWLRNRESVVDATDGLVNFVHQHATPFLERLSDVSDADLNGVWGDALLGSSLSPSTQCRRRADRALHRDAYDGFGTDPADPFFELPRLEPYHLDNRWRRFGAISRSAWAASSATLFPFLEGDLVRFLIGIDPGWRQNNRLYAATSTSRYGDLFTALPHAITGLNIRGERVDLPWLNRGSPVLADYRTILASDPVLGWARELLDPKRSLLHAATGQDFSAHLEITVSGGRNYREHVYRALTLETWLRRHPTVPRSQDSAAYLTSRNTTYPPGRSEERVMTTSWDLLENCLPSDSAEQVSATHFLDQAIADGHADSILLLGADSSLLQSLRRTYHDKSTATLLVQTIAATRSSEPSVQDGEPLPLPSDSQTLVFCQGALEQVADPSWLVSEIARVLAPNGRIVGCSAHLEPPQGLAVRRLTPVGLRLLFEQHGLSVGNMRPGTDGVAMTLYWLHGQSDQYKPFLTATSPLNDEIDEWGKLTGRRAALINNRKLQHCGRFAYSASLEVAAGPTAWMQDVRATGTPPKPSQPSTKRRQKPSFREFDLRLPRPPKDGKATAPPDRIAVQAPMAQFIPRELQRLGLAGYEPESLACYLAAASVAGDGWMWDVGANVGLYGLLAAAMTTRDVVAFEPTPALARTLRSIATANRLQINVEELALSDHQGEATFYLSDRTDASNSLAEGFRQASLSIDVALDTVDRFVDRTQRRPAVMKIDTETTEHDVLRGAEQTILRCRPWILCEVLPGRNEQVIGDLMTAWDYQLFHVDEKSVLEPRDRIVADHGELRNWLFAPRTPGPELWKAFKDWKFAISECGPS